MQQQNIQELLKDAIKKEQERISRAITDTQIKVITATFDKSVAYTNIMLIGGYAGYFALWQLTKEYLTKPQILWAALLVLVSLVFFILFEVIKMIVISKSIQGQAKILNSTTSRTNPEVLLKNLDEFLALQERSSTVFMRYWAVSVAISLSTAIVGAGILGYSFVCSLIR